MYRFEHIWALWLLAALPIWAMLKWRADRALAKTWAAMGGDASRQRLQRNYSPRWEKATWLCQWLGLGFLILALANPQVAKEGSRVKRNGIDLYIAMDISRSMYAQDIRPSRLAKAKETANEVIASLPDARVGFIVFAGNAYLQAPLTNDLPTLRTFIEQASPDMASSQGTAIGEAISLASKLNGNAQKKRRALLILSDGEDHEQDAEQKSREAAENGITIFTMGLGTESGAPVPTSETDAGSYIRDQSGEVVRSVMNPAALEAIAKTGGGVYFDTNELDALLQTLAQAEKGEFEQKEYGSYHSYFQYPLILGLLLWMVGMRRYDFPDKG